jgi:asparagine synthase (glutamine-hydrolysing)
LENGGPATGPAVLDAMLEEIAHRGPDGRGSWQEGPLAFGHVRLAIIDANARAGQPFVTGDGEGVLTYNGEVYNYPELRRELEREGVRFATTSDTEVVAYALHVWGPEAALPRLNGMFAFAYFDRRDRTLWLARDRLGIKPLYVAEAGRRLIFASEIKALLRHPNVAARPDVPMLTAGLSIPHIYGRRTDILGIESIEPGTCWRIKDGQKRELAYFDVLEALDVERMRRVASLPAEDLAAEFTEMVSESVAMHLASDAPLAAACSGGVDSSYVTALALQRLPHTPGFVADVAEAGTISGDGDCARRVADHLGMKLTTVTIRPDELLQHWPTACWLFDGPSYSGSDMALLLMNREMRDAGIKVAVTGEGADELLAGYVTHRTTMRRWRRWRRRLPLRGLFPGIPGLASPPGGLLGRRWGLPPATRALLREPEDLYDAAERRYATFFQKLGAVRPVEGRAVLALCLFDLTGCLSGLLRRMDRLGLGASVEMRVPFLENRTIDFSMHLPFSTKVRERGQKWLLKQAAAKRLPADIVYAPKRAFPIPSGPFDGTEKLLRDGVVCELFEWDRQVLSQAIESFAGTRFTQFRFVALEVWGRMHLRGESRGELVERLVACRASQPGPQAA